MNAKTPEDAPEQPPAKWLQATLDDLAASDINEPIAVLRSAHTHEYSSAYSKLAGVLTESHEPAAQSQRRVFQMLGAVLEMYQRLDQKNRPFGAQYESATRRSALPEDFTGEPLNVLAAGSEKVRNPVVRARLSDVAWLLDRKRSHLGRTAIKAYIDIVTDLDKGDLDSIGDNEKGAFCVEAYESMHRALAIARAIGWQSDEAVSARGCLTKLRESAVAARNMNASHSLIEIDLRYGVSEPSLLAASLERLAETECDSDDGLELWQLAARAYRDAKDDDGTNRCKTNACECLVRQADKISHSAMNAAHLLSMAIAQLHGVPNVRARMTGLRHKLIDVQAGIRDEMKPFSQPIDLTEIVQGIEEKAQKLNLRDLVFNFALMERSPAPEKIVEEARQAIRKHPLASIFGSSHHDDEGKVIHRTAGGDFGDDSDSPAIKEQISQSESLRRQLLVQGQVEPLRRMINDRCYLRRGTFIQLLQYSPFVPPDCLGTYSQGFARFFEGDFISALYILVPMLENSLRYILKSNGYEVTKFDVITQTQQDRTISSLYEQMRPELDAVLGKPITTDIDNVFLSRPGPSIRNELAHGLLSDGEPYGPDGIYACWLIFQLCIIPIFRERVEFPENLWTS